jgi:hypothetical protein
MTEKILRILHEGRVTSGVMMFIPVFIKTNQLKKVIKGHI